MYLKKIIISFFVPFFVATHSFAEQHLEIDPVTKVQEVAATFQWGDIYDEVLKLKNEDYLDQKVAQMLLTYHYLRLGDWQKSRFHLNKSLEGDVPTAINDHKLGGTYLKIMSVAAFAMATKSTPEVEKFIFENLDETEPYFSIDWWALCNVEKRIAFNSVIKSDFSSKFTFDYNCSKYVDHYEWFWKMERAMASTLSKTEALEIIENLNKILDQTESLYEKLKITQTLITTASASNQFEHLLEAAEKHFLLVTENNLHYTTQGFTSLIVIDRIRQLSENTIDENFDTPFHDYLETIEDKKSYLNKLSLGMLGNFIDGLIFEKELVSEEVSLALETVIERWREAKDKGKIKPEDLRTWAIVIQSVSAYYEFVEKDVDKGINSLKEFLNLYEKNSNSSLVNNFLRSSKLLVSKTMPAEKKWRILSGKEGLFIPTEFPTLISQVYAYLGDRLLKQDRYVEAGPYLYKAILLLPPEIRFNELRSLEVLEDISDMEYKISNKTWLDEKINLAIIETAENVLFKAEDSNLIRRFESFDDERKTIANAIYKLRYYYIDKYNNKDKTEQLENRIYNAIQLLRLNRVTLLYASNPEAKKAQVLGLNETKSRAQKLVDRQVTPVNRIKQTNNALKSDLHILSKFKKNIPDDTAILVSYDGKYYTQFAYIDANFFDPIFAEINKNDLETKKLSILKSVQFDEENKILPNFDYESSIWVYEKIFGSDYSKQLFNDKKNIVFLPSQSLFNFPLGLLHNGNSSKGMEETNLYDPNSFLIDQFYIANMVDLDENLTKNVFNKTNIKQAKPIIPKAKSFLGLANPKFTSTELSQLRGLNFVETTINQNQKVNFSALPETLEEIEIASKYFEKDFIKILSGINANKNNLIKENLEQFDVIMFSTHGLAPGMINGFEDSALVLASNSTDQNASLESILLTSTDILNFSLAAEIVILNACSTGLPNARNAPGLTGLAQSFLAAGAGSIMVSHWEIDSDATKAVTEQMFSTLSHEPSFSYNYALSEAQKKLKSQKSTAHPFFWAPFTIYNNF